jgi:hypothetical protein
VVTGLLSGTNSLVMSAVVAACVVLRPIHFGPLNFAGTIWEIRWLHRNGMLPKCVFVMPASMMGTHDYAEAWQVTSRFPTSIGIDPPEYQRFGGLFLLNAGTLRSLPSFVGASVPRATALLIQFALLQRYNRNASGRGRICIIPSPSSPEGDFHTFAKGRAEGTGKGAALGSMEGLLYALSQEAKSSGGGPYAGAAAAIVALVYRVVGLSVGGVMGTIQTVPGKSAQQIEEQINKVLKGMDLSRGLVRVPPQGGQSAIWPDSAGSGVG